MYIILIYIHTYIYIQEESRKVKYTKFDEFIMMENQRWTFRFLKDSSGHPDAKLLLEQRWMFIKITGKKKVCIKRKCI